jgi:hypothetical protein
MLAILVYTCSMTILQISNDPNGHIALGDDGFEVFKSKITILRLLDCHNSPRRAIGCLGEQNDSSGGLLTTSLQPTRNGEQVVTIYSQWRAKLLAVASNWLTAYCCTFQARFDAFRSSFPSSNLLQ